MSSPRSAHAPLSPADLDAIRAAVIAVAERSFFAFASPTAPDTAETGPWYVASAGFDGPVSGRMTVVLSTALARSLLVAFLGCDEADPLEEAAVRDLVGEFANMACGSWLTRTLPHDRVDITHPEVELSETPPGQPSVLMAVNDHAVGVSVELSGVPV